MSKLLTRDQILQADDIRKEVVHVPEWGGDVMVYGLSGRERDQFESGALDLSTGKAVMELVNLRARLCALAIRDENGQHLFSEDDIDLLGKKSASALQRVFETAQRLSAMTSQDVETLTKN